MNICIVAGARPNFIKVAPIIHSIKRFQENGEQVAFELVYTGSKSDETLEPTLFDDLQIEQPNVYLDVVCENLNELTGRVMSAFETYLTQHKTDVVIVVDDLASTLAAAIVTKKQGIKLAHLVAGTRSFDINMPKEINRLVIDGLSDYLFTAGIGGNSVAIKEGVDSSNIYMVGNILMDTLRFNHTRTSTSHLLEELNLKEKNYLLFTLNRKALIKDEKKVDEVLTALLKVADKKTVIAPLRDDAAKVVNKWISEHSCADSIRVVEPLSYLSFAFLAKNACGVITDSGNVAEEATFNGVPCITLNSYTEHIETVKVGTNVLVGDDVELLNQYLNDMVSDKWKHSGIPDRWDGRSADRIVRILFNHCLKCIYIEKQNS